MNQKSTYILKIFLGIFIISFIAAFIVYLQPNKKPLNWLPFKDALIKAKNENKRIVLNFYSRWNPMSRQMDNLIFSVDTLKAKLNSNFILAGINLDDSENKKIAKDVFLIERMPLLIMLNPKGKELNRTYNLMNPNFVYEWLNDSSFIYIDSWLEYKSAMNIAKNENKKLMVLIINNPNAAEYLNNLFNKQRLQLYLMQNFIPVILRKTFADDRELITKISKAENIGENFIYILNPDGTDRGYFIIDSFTQNPVDKIIDEFEKISNKE
jgi:thioredoxin-related protein